MNEEERRKAWQAYLKAQQADAPRKALREAVISDETSAETDQRRGSIDGRGTIQIIFDPPPIATPWTVEDSEESSAVSGDSVREEVRQDGTGQT